ncbi:hypothetical protein [uncultured Erythrobacter sp.]|uniref:hypothetical protein n=1 Tax=uncultured Erythrobacter sp. TaxID=263913 RepID=UPI00262C7A93|nr:hypothetical protein [uncultured Erythrobacter sp.]
MLKILRPIVGNADKGTGRIGQVGQRLRGTANTGGREPEWSGQAVDPIRLGLSKESSSFHREDEGRHGLAVPRAI